MESNANTNVEAEPLIIIRLVFTYEREIIVFEICNRYIVYKDRKWPKGFQFMPKDEKIIKAILMSRNRIKNEMIRWINDSNSGKNLEEYNAAKNDAELAEIVIKDAKLKGCVLRQRLRISINKNGEEVEVPE
jgi:hypothetical protein